MKVTLTGNLPIKPPLKPSPHFLLFSMNSMYSPEELHKLITNT